MLQDTSSSARSPSPAQFGKIKPSCAQDVLWGRPVFRAPELSTPQLAFAPLPVRGQFFSGQRSAVAH
jgi:hypothetical protein